MLILVDFFWHNFVIGKLSSRVAIMALVINVFIEKFIYHLSRLVDIVIQVNLNRQALILVTFGHYLRLSKGVHVFKGVHEA